MGKYKIAVIPGDGIGKEVIDEGVKVLKIIAANHPDLSFVFDYFPWGCEYYLQHQEMMPKDGMEILKGYDAIYLGAVGDPRVSDSLSLRELLLRIRKEFDQYINLRPIKLLKGITNPLANVSADDIDMIFIRENSEGEYYGSGAWLYPNTPNEVVIQNGVFSRFGCERVMRYAFELASKEKRTLTSISKGNALNYSMVFWDQIFNEMKSSYPNVETHTCLVDAASMYMVSDPRRFQIVVTSNLFGDILTDLGAAITGGMGIAAGANLNPERKFPSMFEPIHGSAPSIAGKKIANPIAAIISASQMLDHLGYPLQATEIVRAVETVLMAKQFRTPDLGGKSSTSEVGEAIAQLLISKRNEL